MKKTNFYHIVRLMRPRQWIKNFAIFAAITFGGSLFDLSLLQKALLGFACFCAVASSTYIINDIFDIKKDRLHPFKRFRPLAKGDISIPVALVFAVLLLIISSWLAMQISLSFISLI